MIIEFVNANQDFSLQTALTEFLETLEARYRGVRIIGSLTIPCSKVAISIVAAVLVQALADNAPSTGELGHHLITSCLLSRGLQTMPFNVLRMRML